ncbi:ABC-2 family transporter protein [Anatilimnocola aggregata]|uniref:ABC-2 family transporter protein n=1 Tax=Anatilimnocola aggregata TaxID=2528021 RepID=A0A517Y7B6_9BACT|nr:ABC transporter permease subunit [Anatilimnocola aggregata]QDU26116.1 ABC-2 family transporter protein [Anatilimnocola aggregata]
MNRILLRKCLAEVQLLFIACALLLFTFCWVRVFIVASLETSAFASIIDKLWENWGRFSPVPLSQLLSYSGRVAIAYDEPVVVFCIAIFAIARGSAAVSGELGRGTMEMLLAQPISRMQVLYSQAAVTVSCLALLCILSWLGTWSGIHTAEVTEQAPAKSISIPLLDVRIPIPFGPREKIKIPMRERVTASNFAPGALNLFCLGFCVAGVTTLASACDRYRWRTIGIVSCLFVLQMIFKVLGRAFDSTSFFEWITIFGAYEPQRLVYIAVDLPQYNWALSLPSIDGRPAMTGPLTYYITLVTIGTLGYLAAGVVFHRRDLPAPL